MENSFKRCLSAPVIVDDNSKDDKKSKDDENKRCKESEETEEMEIQQQETLLPTNTESDINNESISNQTNSGLQNKVLTNNLVQEKLNSVPGGPELQPTRLSLNFNVRSACNSPQRSHSREASPAPILNIFSASRPRRYSASSFSPLSGASLNCPRLTPRVSQLRQEECVDMNSREVNQEREMHSAIQISQSWEDLTLVAENWSCKSSDDSPNPLNVTLPGMFQNCGSPSPTSRTSLRMMPSVLQSCSSPSPTRRTSFTTRRSMSPIAQLRPSQLGPVKRKFDNFETDSNWSTCYSPPPFKKIFSESRGSSPICNSPTCPSPADSGIFNISNISKLCTSSSSSTASCNSNSSTSTIAVPSPDIGIDLQSDDSPRLNDCSAATYSKMSEDQTKENIETLRNVNEIEINRNT